MIMLLRILLVGAFTFAGHYLGFHYFSSALLDQFPWLSATVGGLAGFVVILIDLYFQRLSVRNILSVLIGATLGLWVHSLLMQVVRNYAAIPQDQLRQFGILSASVFAYLGAITILRGQDEFAMMIPFVKFTAKGATEDIILLDTSVIIDGRVADICETSLSTAGLPIFVKRLFWGGNFIFRVLY